MSEEPIRKISVSKYPRETARIRVRVKGSSAEGAVYKGVELVKPCSNCGKPSQTPLL